MIKVEDLRIGDLVRYGQQVYTIQAVNANGIVHFAELDLPVECSLLESIQITTEILEKNGWLRKEYACEVFYYIGLNIFADIFLAYDDKNECFSVGLFLLRSGDLDILCFPLDIKYIHELQHILYLFKEGPEIKKMKPLQL